jgi:hypothetical protein
MVLAASFVLCGCRTKVTTPASMERSGGAAMVENVLAAYGRYFPEAQRVALATNALNYFAGVYHTGEPDGLALGGRNLYLFPDGRFILTEWADIMPETMLMAGGWSYMAEQVCLTAAKPPDLVEDLTFVPLRFVDARRDILVLLGVPEGFHFWTTWVMRYEPELRKARERYNEDVRVRTDFRFTTQAEEVLYLTFFCGTYTQVCGFSTNNWESLREHLLLRLQPSRQ